MRRGAVSLTAALVASLVISGCGPLGDDSKSKDDFIEEVDAVCKRAGPVGGGNPQNQAQAERVARAELAARRKGSSEFEKAAEDPPEDLADDVGEYERMTAQVITLLEEQVAAAEADREQDYARLTRRAGDILVEREQVADRIGFKVCGQPVRSAPADSPAGSGGGAVAAERQFRAAAGRVGPDIRTFGNDFKRDANAGNIAAAKATTSKFRDAMYDFDGEIRKIDFPPGAVSLENDLLEANRSLIADLDALGPAQGATEFNRISRRIAADLRELSSAIRGLDGYFR